MHEVAYQLLSHAKATWRYRWFAIVIAWIIALGGWASVHRMPDRYEASARVWVNTQSVVKHLLAGLTAQPNVNQIVGMLSRTLISRPNLEKVIRMAEMDVELETPRDMEQLITRLSREVSVQSVGSDSFFIIRYTNKDPQKAKLVVQSLLTIFEDESFSDRRKDSEAAQRFIDEELKTYKEKLEAAESAMIEFRRRQTNTIPGGRGDYSAQLVSAEAALSEAILELKIAQTNRDAIKRNAVDAPEVPSLLAYTPADAGANREIDARITALEQQLDALRLNYTEQHPDIAAIVRTIAQLKAQNKAEPKPSKPPTSPAQAVDPVHQQLTLSVAAAEAHVAAVEARVKEYSERYNELKAAAIAAPQIDAEYTQVARDYDTAKSNYGALLARRETARISAEMEARTSATDFRVIDPPLVPSIPNAPNRRLLNSMVLLMAIGGGIAFAFVLSQIRPTFYDERRLRDVSGAHVLGTVIMAWTDAQKVRRNWGLAALLISFGGLLSAYAAIIVMLGLMSSRA